MLQMLPLRDAGELVRLNAATGTDAAFAYCLYGARETGGDDPDGWLLYDLNFTSREVTLRALDAPSLPCADGLIRAVFASALELGIVSARLAPELAEEPFVRLGFTQPGGRVIASLEEAITRCKCCGAGQSSAGN